MSFGRGPSGGVNTNNRPTCKFFLEGRCRYGDACHNYHPPRNSNQSSLSSNLPFSLTRDGIKADLTFGDDRPIWPLSAYGPGKDAPRQLLEGALEQSPEELRVQYYLAKASGAPQQYEATEQAALAEAGNRAKQILDDIDGALKYVIDGKDAHPNRDDQVLKPTTPFNWIDRPRFDAGSASASNTPFAGQPSAFGSSANNTTPAFGQPTAPGTTPAFGQASTPASTFGAPAASNTAFGAPSALGGGSTAFGRRPALGGSSNAFGQPSPLGGASPFGQTASAGAGPGFGQPSPLAGGTAFGKPSPFGASAAATPAFGQTGFGSQPSTSSPAFGQASQPNQQPSPFGQPTQPGQQSSPFGQPAQTNQTPSAFGEASQPGQKLSPFGQTPSAFGQPSQPGQQPSPFARPSPFGAASAATTPAFGQTAFGNASAPNNTAFGQSPAPNPSPFGSTAPQSTPFGASASPTPNPNPFGAQQQQQPATGFGSSATTTPRQPGQPLTTFHGRPVIREDGIPYYQNSAGKKERIFNESGPPAANSDVEASPEVYEALGTALKQVYDYVRENGRFEGGLMPEVPPKREWVSWEI